MFSIIIIYILHHHYIIISSSSAYYVGDCVRVQLSITGNFRCNHRYNHYHYHYHHHYHYHYHYNYHYHYHYHYHHHNHHYHHLRHIIYIAPIERNRVQSHPPPCIHTRTPFRAPAPIHSQTYINIRDELPGPTYGTRIEYPC